MNKAAKSENNLGTLIIMCVFLGFVSLIGISNLIHGPSTLPDATEELIVKKFLYKSIPSGGKGGHNDYVISITFEEYDYRDLFYIQEMEYQTLDHDQFLTDIGSGDTLAVQYTTRDRIRTITSLVKRGKQYIDRDAADRFEQQNLLSFSVITSILFLSILIWLVFPAIRSDTYQGLTIILLIIATVFLARHIECNAIQPKSYKRLWKAKVEQQRQPTLNGTPLDRLNKRRDSLRLLEER